MKAQIAHSSGYVRRSKSIYYDTDDIQEKQTETVRVCDECGGLVMIESAADTGRKIFAVILPNRCCPECRKNGEMFFERVNSGQYNNIYMQDRERDVFIVK
jgi:NAD-dependent SIR2 family protein deacetylase